MTDNMDTLLNGGVFDPKECVSSEELAKELELPLLRSERKELNERIKQVKIEAESSFHSAIRSCIETVNRSEELTATQKENLIRQFYDKE